MELLYYSTIPVQPVESSFCLSVGPGSPEKLINRRLLRSRFVRHDLALMRHWSTLFTIGQNVQIIERRGQLLT